jgi:hypothetical protein
MWFILISHPMVCLSLDVTKLHRLKGMSKCTTWDTTRLTRFLVNKYHDPGLSWWPLHAYDWSWFHTHVWWPSGFSGNKIMTPALSSVSTIGGLLGCHLAWPDSHMQRWQGHYLLIISSCSFDGKRSELCIHMPNTRRFLSAASFSPDTAEDIAPKSMWTTASHWRSQSRGIVYLHVLNRQRWATRQLLFVMLETHNFVSKNNTLS